jgi:hypothetical protein
LPLADAIHLTEVEANVEGDTYFPAFDRKDWDTREVLSSRRRSQCLPHPDPRAHAKARAGVTSQRPRSDALEPLGELAHDDPFLSIITEKIAS